MPLFLLIFFDVLLIHLKFNVDIILIIYIYSHYLQKHAQISLYEYDVDFCEFLFPKLIFNVLDF